MRKNRAFTLIELLILLAIFGIIAALAIPFFMSFYNKKEVPPVVEERIKLVAGDFYANCLYEVKADGKIHTIFADSYRKSMVKLSERPIEVEIE